MEPPQKLTQKDQQSKTIEINQQPKDNPTLSEYTEEYFRFIKLTHKNDMSHLKQTAIRLLQDKGQVSGNEWTFEDFFFEVISYTSDSQCLVLKVAKNIFTFIITILISRKESPFHQCLAHYSGNISSVYRTLICGKEMAVKCCCFTNQNFIEVLINSISEYICFKIASELEVGPMIDKSLGIDLVLYDECVQFCMEFCDQKNLQKVIHIAEEDLIAGLKLLHSLHIVHMDIKPENVAYSKRLQKFVFIDFGLHSIIKEDIGAKTLTSFKGSVNFCSEEMAKCFECNDVRQIDLYYNDAHCLMKTLEELKRNNQMAVYSQSFQIVEKAPNEVDLLLLKGTLVKQHLIFNNITLIKSASHLLSSIQEPILSKQAKQFIRMMKQKSVKEDLRINYRDSYEKTKVLIERISKSRKGGQHLLNGKIDFQECEELKKIDQSQLMNKQSYLFQVSKYMNFFNYRIPTQAKQQISKVFNSLYIQKQQFYQLQVKEKLHSCFMYLIKYALDRNTLGNNEFAIIKNCFASITFFQILPHNQYQVLLRRIINVKGTMLRRIRMFVVVFCAVQWINQRLISPYNYYYLMDIAYGCCNKYIRSLNKGDLSQKENIVIGLLQNIFSNNIGESFLNKIQNLFGFKMYLSHAMTHDYQLVLAQIYNYALIISFKTATMSNLGHFKIFSQFSMEQSFLFEDLKVFFHFHKMEYFSQILSQYNIPLQQFVHIIAIWKLYMSHKFQYKSDINIYEYIAKGKDKRVISLLEVKPHFMFKAINHLINLLVHKLIEGTILSQQLILKVLQRYFLSIGSAYHNFHNHSLIRQIFQLIALLDRIDRVFPTLLQFQRTLSAMQLLGQRLSQYQCCYCKLISLAHTKMFVSIKYGSLTHDIQEEDLSIFTYLLKIGVPINIFSEIFTHYHRLMKINIEKSYKCKYDYIQLIFYITKVYNFNFQIYFSPIFRGNPNQKASLIGQTMFDFWITDHQLYFYFLQKMFVYMVSIASVLQNLFVLCSEIIASEDFLINYLRSTSGQSAQQFLDQNLKFFKPKLKFLHGQSLVVYLLTIMHHVIEQNNQLIIEPIFFLFVWKEIQNVYPNVIKLAYGYYLQYNHIFKGQTSSRKYYFLLKKYFRQNCKGQMNILKIIERPTKVKVRVNHRSQILGQMFLRLFKQKVKFIQYQEKSQMQ